MTDILIKKRILDRSYVMREDDLKTDTGRMPHEDESSDWSDGAVSQGMPNISSHPKKVGGGPEGFFPESQRKHDPANTLLTDF